MVASNARLGHAAATAAFLLAAACGVMPSKAAELGRDGLAAVAVAYAQGVADLNAVYRACAPDRASGWDEGRDMLLASLAAAGLPDPLMATIRTTLEAAPGAAPDCKSAEVAQYTGLGGDGSWTAYHKVMLDAVGVAMVTLPGRDPRLTALTDAIAAEAEPQGRMLRCLSLLDPAAFVLAYADWTNVAAAARADMEAAGMAADDIALLLDPIRPETLFQPVADRAAARTDCAGSDDWATRYGTLAWYGLPGRVKSILDGGGK